MPMEKVDSSKLADCLKITVVTEDSGMISLTADREQTPEKKESDE